MKYSNPNWEPYFRDIDPILAKIYFATNIGFLRRAVASLIFKKIDYLENRKG